MASRLGRRIALAVVAPAAVALGAVDLLAVRAARDAERSQVLRRMEGADAALAEDPRFFLAAPLDAARISARLARIAGFDFVLARGTEAPISSLPPGAAEEALRATPAAARGPDASHGPDSSHGPDFSHGVEIRAGGEGYLALRRDRGATSLVLLFPTAAVERAGREAALPVLIASAAGLLAAAGAGLLLGERLARPLRSLADTARAVAREGTPAEATAGSKPGEGRRADESRGPAEVRDLAASLNAMLDALRAAEEAKLRRERLAVLGEFAAGVAHEIRNPLASMRMTLQLLGDGHGGEGLRGKDAEDLRVVLDEVRRLEGSVEDLLLYAGTPLLAREPVDLAAVARDAARVLERQASHLGVALEVEEAAGAPRAAGDPARLRTCATNLLLNAVQASPRGGKVRARCAGTEKGIALEVADEGPGIPPEVGERVYEPFFTGRPGGTGLGLAVTRRLAEAHGGSLSYRSGPGGTVFRLEVPSILGESPPAG
jgi:signal transduction histidine kinase